MPSRLKRSIDRFTGRNSALPSLDLLATDASPSDSLENRLNWLVDLGQWIRRAGHEADSQSLAGHQLQSGRLRRLLDTLDKNPEWKKAVAQTLRSIIRETSALELFSETGLPRQFGLIQEIGERLAKKFLPNAGSAELGILFDRLFPHRHDDEWIENLDEPTLQRFFDLLEYEVEESEKDWNQLTEELEDSLFHLAAQLRVSGCSGAIRARVKHERIRELPFFKLQPVLQAVMTAREKNDQETLLAELNYLHAVLDGCHRSAEEVLTHLEKRGVSTEVVYQIAFIEASLERFETLLELAFSRDQSVARITAFIAMLVRANRGRESISGLLRQNFQLMTRKILERNAETGEHYFARTPREYVEMLQRAAGGGVLMAFTTWFKVVILSWPLSAFMQGLATSTNYAAGFVAIQVTGCTLATKQPANTAPALAARMHQVRDPKALEALVDEIVCLARSQFASIAGNIALVVPTVLALHFMVLWLSQRTIMDEEKANHMIASLSVLGPSIFYGAFTGVLLWASSMIAAWADNWFVCHRIGESLETNRRMVRVFGTTRSRNVSQFWSKNIAGFAGNISFGFMLGLIPVVATFIGLPLDVRHVTLSSSMLATASATLGSSVFQTAPFWLAVGGIAGIGLMNLFVSFSLALGVAIRARGIQSPERSVIYRELFKRFRQRPLSFVLPVGLSNASPPSITLPAKSA